MACLALLIQESTALQFHDAGELPEELMKAFWDHAVDARPEFRPPAQMRSFEDSVRYRNVKRKQFVGRSAHGCVLDCDATLKLSP